MSTSTSKDVKVSKEIPASEKSRQSTFNDTVLFSTRSPLFQNLSTIIMHERLDFFSKDGWPVGIFLTARWGIFAQNLFSPTPIAFNIIYIFIILILSASMSMLLNI